jgi:formylmethanofuran dehydrogenase subunit A
VTEQLRVAGGRVYDPGNGVDGEIRDVCLEGGRIVAELPQGAPVLDAGGLVVMPGGVDIHCHIAGHKVNLARRLEPETRRDRGLEKRMAGGTLLRSGTCGTVPSTFATGRLYSLLGYTTAFDAAVPLLGARQAHLELNDTPFLDKGFYLVLGNDEFLLRPLGSGDLTRARETLAWALHAARAYAVKVVNPGGVHAWKSTRAVIGLDDPVPGRGLTPRRIVQEIATAADELRLPHPMHLHCNNLGVAGNASTTLETMRALEGRRAHFAHLQFHCYGGEPGGRLTSRAPEVIEELNRCKNLSADVGQVMFGPATTMTADLHVAEMLHELSGRKWVNADLELEGGCGIVPYAYREGNLVHALQWAAGLEMLLLAADPWRLVLSTDHPNGGTFLAYPRLIRLLMDRAFRDEQIRGVKSRALEGTALADGLSREYSLSEIAIITRAGPARLLGLGAKGHLGPGADADVTIYTPDPNREKMFATPRYVIKGGVLVVGEGQIRRAVYGRTLHVAPDYDSAVERPLRDLLETDGTLSLEDYVISEEELRDSQPVTAAGRLG